MTHERRYAAVLFDMDGLLLDTEALAVDAWQQTAQLMGRPIPRDVMIETIGRDDKDTKAIILDHMGADFPFDMIQDERRELMQRWMEQRGIPCRPWAQDTLRRLQSADIPMALATSTDKSRALWRMEQLGWTGYFSALAFGSEVTHGKPAPDIFLLAAGRLGVRPECCAVLEDSPGGLRGARAAGMAALMVPDLKAPDDMLCALVDGIFQDLKQACDHILGISDQEDVSCRK